MFRAHVLETCRGMKQTYFKTKILCTKLVNPLTLNDHYSGRTASLISKRYILYIYSTNTCTEYFKHGKYSPCFSLQNVFCFIILTYLVPVLFTFYIQSVLKLKKIHNSGAKRLIGCTCVYVNIPLCHLSRFCQRMHIIIYSTSHDKLAVQISK